MAKMNGPSVADVNAKSLFVLRSCSLNARHGVQNVILLIDSHGLPDTFDNTSFIGSLTRDKRVCPVRELFMI